MANKKQKYTFRNTKSYSIYDDEEEVLSDSGVSNKYFGGVDVDYSLYDNDLNKGQDIRTSPKSLSSIDRSYSRDTMPNYSSIENTMNNDDMSVKQYSTLGYNGSKEKDFGNAMTWSNTETKKREKESYSSYSSEPTKRNTFMDNMNKVKASGYDERELKRSVLDRVGDFLSVGQYVVQGSIQAGISDEQTFGDNMKKAFKSANPLGDDYTEGEFNTSDTMAMLGWNPTSKTGKFAKGAVGLLGDIFLDPVTYLSFGTKPLISGSGKVMKGAKNATGLTADMATQIIKKTKGGAYVPAVDEVADLVNRANKLIGITEDTGKGLGLYGDAIPFHNKLGLTNKKLELVSEQTLKNFGDMTIAPYFNKIADKAKHSTLFSTKGHLIDLARNNPEELYKVYEFAEESAKKGLNYEKHLEKIEERVSELKGLDEAEQRKIVELMENKDFFQEVATTYEKANVNIKDTDEGKDIITRMQHAILNLGNKDAEMKAINDELKKSLPKFNLGEEVVFNSKHGQVPVIVENMYNHRGTRYYKVKGSDKYFPESVLDDMPKAEVKATQNAISKQVKEAPTKNLNVDKQGIGYDDFMSLIKEEGVKKGVKKMKESPTLVNIETGAPVKFDNLYSNRDRMISPNIHIDPSNGVVTHTKTGEVFGNIEDIKNVPVHKISKTKGVTPQQWGKVKKTAVKDIKGDVDGIKAIRTGAERLRDARTMFNKAVTNNEILSDIFKPLIDSGTLSEHLSLDKISRFMDSYFNGKLEDITKNVHIYHKDYGTILQMLENNPRYGSYKNLADKANKLKMTEKALKAERMEEMYKLMNNPKAIDEYLNKRTLDIGSNRQLITEMEQSITKSDKAMEDAYNKRFKDGQSRPDYVRADDIKSDNNLYDSKAYVYRKGQQPELVNLVDDTHVEINGEVVAIKDVDGNVKVLGVDKTVSGTTTSKHPSTTFNPSKAQDEIEALYEQQAKLNPSKKPSTPKEAISNRLSKSELIEQEMSKLPSNIEEAIKADKNHSELIASKISEYSKALENDANFETYAKTILGNDKFSSITNKTVEHVENIGRLIDNIDLDDTLVKIVDDLKDTFARIGKEEVMVGKLDAKAYKDNVAEYVAHILTPEAKEFLDNAPKETLDKLGLRNASSGFSISRKHKGTVTDINAKFKELLDGNDLFADKISDIYLARMQGHEKLMYHDSIIKDIQTKFGTPYKAGALTKPNNKHIISLADLKKELPRKYDKNGNINKAYATRIKQLGIDPKDVEKLGSNFMELTEAQAKTIATHTKAKSYQVNNMIVDKANELMNVNFAKDVNGFLRGYDKFLNSYKFMVTALRPTFHVNNAWGNLFNNYLDVGSRAVNPKFHKSSIEMARGMDGTIELAGKQFSYKDIMEKANIHGVIGKGWFGEELGAKMEKQVAGQSLVSKIKAVPGNVGSAIEDQGRLVNFISNLDIGRSYRESAMHVDKFLFDYGDLTKFEKDVMKRIVPFYTFMKKNNLVQLEQMISNPQKYMPIVKTIDGSRNFIDKEDRVDKSKLPSYAQHWVQLPYTWMNEKGQKQALMWGNNLPYVDTMQLGELFTDPHNSLNRLTPAIKIPTELAMNENSFGQPIRKEDGAKVLDPTGQIEISPTLSYFLNQVPQIKEGGQVIKETGVKKMVRIFDRVAGMSTKSWQVEK